MKRTLSHAIAAALCVFTISASAATTPDSVQARKELTAMGLSYNSQDQFLAAVRKKDQIAISLFLAGKGIDLNASDEKSDATAFNIAYKTGDTEFAKYLLKAGAAPQPGDLVYAIKKDNRGFLQDMLSAPAFAKAAINDSVMWTAIYTEKREVVEQLLQNVDDSNAEKAITGKTINGMIIMPSLRDAVLIESALKKLGDKSKTMLNSRGSVPMRDSNWMPSRPLNFAAMEDKKSDVIALLIKYGADVNTIDLLTTRRGPSGGMEARVPETPLMTAVRRQNIPAISLLLKAGADPNQVIVQDTFGFFAISTHKVTALSYVEVTSSMRKGDKNFEENQAEVVRLLKEAGAKTPDEIKG
jgi:ankyrin repeat protein